MAAENQMLNTGWPMDRSNRNRKLSVHAFQLNIVLAIVDLVVDSIGEESY